MNDEREELCRIFHEVVGEDGCGVSCSEAEFYQQDGEWKMFLAGFMEPWPLGRTLMEAKASIREYATMAFGLS